MSELRLETTPAMRARQRELSNTPGKDDYDRVTIMLLDDLARCLAYIAPLEDHVSRCPAEIERLTRERDEAREKRLGAERALDQIDNQRHAAEASISAALAEIERLTRERDEAQMELKRRFPISKYNGLDIEQWKSRAETVERERDEALRGHDSCKATCDRLRGMLTTAEASLSAALAEIERLTSALEPFKRVSEYFDADTEGFADADELSLMPKGTDFELYTLTVGDFRRAALSPTPPEKA